MIYLKNTTAPQEVWIPRQDTNIQAVHKDCYTEGYDDGYNSGYEDGLKEGIPLQEKSVTIVEDLTEVLPDGGYSAMTKVTADATEYAQGRYDAGYADGKAEFKLQSKVYEVTEDTGNVTPDDDYDGLSSVEVDAVMYGKSKYNEGHSEGYTSGYSEGQASVRLQEKSVSSSTATVEVTPDEGYSGMTKVSVDSSAYGQAQYQSGYTEGQESVKIQSKSVEITGDTQTITPDSGYDAMSAVTANAGTYGESRYNEGYDKGVEDTTPTLQYKSVVVDADEMEIVPDEGYDALSRVDVDAVTYGKAKYDEGVASVRLQSKSVEVVANGEQTVSPDSGYSGMSAVTLNVNVPTGSTINNQDKTVELDLTGATATTAVTFDEDYTGLGTVTVNADATDYGNARYAEGQASVSLQEKSVTLTQSGITSIVPDDGYSGMSSVSVNTPMQRYSKNIGGSDPDNWNVYPDNGYIGFNFIHLDIQDLRRQVTQEGIAQGQEQITRQIKDLDVSANGTYTANTEGDKYLNFTGNSIYDLETWGETYSHICIATIRTYPDSEGIIISNHHNRWSSLDWDSTVYGINISNSGTVVEFKDCGLYASGTITTGIWHTLEFSKDSSTNELIAKIDDVLLPTSGTFSPQYDGRFTIGNTAKNIDWLNTKYNAFSSSPGNWNRDLIAQNDAEYRGIIAVVNEDYRQVAPSNGNYAIYKDDAVYGWSSVTVNVTVSTTTATQTEYEAIDPKDANTIYLINDGDGIVRAYQGERLIYGDAPSE